MSSSLATVLLAAASEDIGGEHLLEHIDDTMLTEAILCLSNSALRGSRTRIDNLQQAVVCLGTRALIELILRHAENRFEKRLRGSDNRNPGITFVEP